MCASRRTEVGGTWPLAFACFLISLIVPCAVTPVAAQDGVDRANTRETPEDTAKPGGETTAPDADTGGLDIPIVDEIEAVIEPPEARLVTLTLGLYSAVLAWENDCKTMHVPVQTYLDAHGSEIAAAADELTLRAPDMTDEELRAMAAYFQENILGHELARAAQDKLYLCLRSLDVQARGRPLDKQMRRFFALQEALLLAIVGNVD